MFSAESIAPSSSPWTLLGSGSSLKMCAGRRPRGAALAPGRLRSPPASHLPRGSWASLSLCLPGHSCPPLAMSNVPASGVHVCLQCRLRLARLVGETCAHPDPSVKTPQSRRRQGGRGWGWRARSTQRHALPGPAVTHSFRSRCVCL